MQFSAVTVLALAGAASASYGYQNATTTSAPAVVYTTETYTSLKTICTEATQLTYNGVTYTATASQTLTITNCPCTVVKPVTVSSYVAVPTTAPVAPVYPTSNGTAPVYPAKPTTTAVGTTSAYATGTPKPTTVPTSGANKAFALSGASLAGLLGLAAYIL